MRFGGRQSYQSFKNREQASTLRKSTRQKVHTSHWGGQQRWIDVWNGMVEFQLRSMTKLQKPNF